MGKTQQVMAFGLMAALAVVFYPSFGTWDILIWLRWAGEIAEHGLVSGYSINPLEYPPLGFVVLHWATILSELSGIHHFYTIKLTLLFFLFATTIILYRQSGQDIGATFFYYVALLFSSLALSYLDIYLAPFLLLAFEALRRDRWKIGLLLYATAVMTKYTPLIFSPFVLLFFLSSRFVGPEKSFTNVMRFTWPSLLLVAVVLMVFGYEPVNALFRSFGQSDLSSNALNFNWVQTRVIQIFLSGGDLIQAYNLDSQLLRNPPLWALVMARTLFFVFYLSSLFFFWRGNRRYEDFLIFSLLGCFSYFIFNIGVHENHLFVGILLAIALANAQPAFRTLAINVCLISSLNLFAFYSYNGELPDLWRGAAVSGWEGNNAWMNGGPPFDFRLLMAIFNVIFFLSLWFSVARMTASRIDK
jgi:hypothetical protein